MNCVVFLVYIWGFHIAEEGMVHLVTVHSTVSVSCHGNEPSDNCILSLHLSSFHEIMHKGKSILGITQDRRRRIILNFQEYHFSAQSNQQRECVVPSWIFSLKWFILNIPLKAMAVVTFWFQAKVHTFLMTLENYTYVTLSPTYFRLIQW